MMINNSENKELINKIISIKENLGKKLLILTHHYQRKEIVTLGDYTGDSFGLSQKAATDGAAQYIIFCGVHFMAESAAILSQPHQCVQIPAFEAGCWMADMTDIFMLEKAYEEIFAVKGIDTIVPVVYMNSDAELKAFCGRNGGIVCTSSNAVAAFDWGFKNGDKILFLPDQHLGRNTCNMMGIPSEEIILWKPDQPFGGNRAESIKKAKVILWDGYCLVHTRFQVEHIHEMKEKFPEAKIFIHPECTQEVVALADAVGSTGFIVKYVDNSAPGSIIIVGTEINLIDRLNAEYPDKEILPLHHSLCPNMFKINLNNLLWSLENMGSVNVVTVPEEIKADARKALDSMLALA